MTNIYAIGKIANDERLVISMSRGEIPYWVYQMDTSNIQSSHYEEIRTLNDT